MEIDAYFVGGTCTQKPTDNPAYFHAKQTHKDHMVPHNTDNLHI